MAATRLADVIVPEVWLPYMVERTAELSALWRSGIVGEVDDLDVSEGGNTLQMPFWQDLTGASQVISATGTALTVNAISSEKDIAVVLGRGNAWGANEYAAHLSGDDPLRTIGDLVAEWWARDMQTTLLAILTGIFGTALATSHTHDISALTGGAEIVSADSILDAQQLLGDAKDKLSAIVMHSAVENKLKKLGLIDYVDPADGSPRYAVYLDKRVIVDDGMPVSSGTYTTYLFGPGAFGFHDGTAESTKVTGVETDRDTLAGEDILINRRVFVLHPRGVKYVGAATGGGPTNAVLDDAASWSKVYTDKNIRIVRHLHKIA